MTRLGAGPAGSEEGARRAPSGDGAAVVGELARAVDELQAAGVPTPRVDAELLAAHAARTDRSGVHRLLATRASWPGDVAERFAGLVAARCTRVPLQHLLGRAPFRRLELRVGPGVFVPRPETEVLAGLAVDETRRAGGELGVVDLCTGSGAVALSVALEAPNARVAGVELDPRALAWAEQSRQELAARDPGVAERVELSCGDATDRQAVADILPVSGPLAPGAVAVVTVNPPYIPDAAVPREPEVAAHDPALALYGGADGLDIVRGVVETAAGLLRPGGLFLVEHGEQQARGIAQLLAAPRWRGVEHHRDLAGRPRVTLARRGSPAAQ